MHRTSSFRLLRYTEIRRNYSNTYNPFVTNLNSNCFSVRESSSYRRGVQTFAKCTRIIRNYGLDNDRFLVRCNFTHRCRFRYAASFQRERQMDLRKGRIARENRRATVHCSIQITYFRPTVCTYRLWNDVSSFPQIYGFIASIWLPSLRLHQRYSLRELESFPT